MQKMNVFLSSIHKNVSCDLIANNKQEQAKLDDTERQSEESDMRDIFQL
jgi:hypothetical protein